MHPPKSSSRLLLLLLLLALSGSSLLSGCKTKSPTNPTPAAERGSVVLLHNDSYFYASVSAGFDCRDSRTIDVDDQDFSPVFFDYELTCSAEAQGEPHSANMDLQGSLTYEYEAPDDRLSAIRLQSRAVGNRSATGLAGSGAVVRLWLRFEIVGDPVPFRAIGSHTCMDSSTDLFWLQDFASASTFVYDLYCGNQEGSLDLDTTGTLAAGIYGVRVDVTALDWFTEEVEFVLMFP